MLIVCWDTRRSHNAAQGACKTVLFGVLVRHADTGRRRQRPAPSGPRGRQQARHHPDQDRGLDPHRRLASARTGRRRRVRPVQGAALRAARRLPLRADAVPRATAAERRTAAAGARPDVSRRPTHRDQSRGTSSCLHYIMLYFILLTHFATRNPEIRHMIILFATKIFSIAQRLAAPCT